MRVDPGRRRRGSWAGFLRPAVAGMLVLALVAACGGGTAEQGGGDTGGPNLTYNGARYLGFDPALTKVDPTRAFAIGTASEVANADVQGDAVYSIGTDPRDAVGMKTPNGTFMVFIREDAGAVALNQELCRLFLDPSAQPGC